MIKKTLLLSSLALGATSLSLSADTTTSNSDSKDGNIKVLYVTHEPGRYHAYTPQRKIFEEIAKRNNWTLKVMSGSHDEVEEKLASNPDFGKGADVIVYNICMAKSKKLDAPFNIIQTTKEKGIPALLVHCSLHSFWPTYKHGDVTPEGANPKAKTKPEFIAKWKETHPNDEFPSWPNMTGIASTAHGPRKPVDAKPIDSTHPIFKGVEKGYTTAPKAELYNNFITGEDSKNTTILLNGKQGNKEAAILWEHPVGKSKSLSFTLGHDTAEWSQPEFQTIITNSVHYLAKDK
ncbi:ThuA domain-containing protein [Rubritalea tangerina]|uniref:ThuA domain-containing protein n=1 Tax=Rubritalea tangerina TaxID=430798 RepID=A0ABW4Z7X3_9BACT